MNIFFILQITGFFISVILLNHWINLLLTRRPFFNLKYLPCFAWGWFIYFAIYMIGRWISAPVASIRMIYTWIALVVPILASIGWLFRPHASLWQRRRQDLPLDRWTLLLVGIFVGGMIYVGPYLEFPSDPVEHLYRIQAWEKAIWTDYKGDYYENVVSRFAYFFEHWILQPSHLSFGNRTGLALLSPLLQGMLFWQFIRLTKILTNVTFLSWLGGLMSLGYFGYGAISFYRYTVLSGALLSHLIFLEGLILIIATFSKEKWRYLLLLPPLMIFCLKNHEQETLLQVNAIAGFCILLFTFRYRNFAPKFKRVMLIGIITLVVFSISICFNKAVIEDNDSNLINSSLVSIPNFWGGTMHFYRFNQLNEMIGILGWLSLIGAVLVLLFNRPCRNLDIIACLCIWPFIVLWNPLSVEVLLRFITIDASHRLIYGSLYWIFPIVFLQHICHTYNYSNTFLNLNTFRYLPKVNLIVSKYLPLYIVIIFFILLAWVPGEPMRGKMGHLWIKGEPTLDGSNLQPTIEFLRKNSSRNCINPNFNKNHLPIRSYILSDSYVNTYLMATGYFYAVTNRRETEGYESPPVDITVSPNEDLRYDDFLKKVQKSHICYVILYIQRRDLYSWLGAVMGHWRIDHAKTQRYYSEKFIQWITENPQNFQFVFEDDLVRVFRVL